MYQALKKTTLKLIPKSLLFKFEPFLRGIFSLSHKGNAYTCNICDSGWKEFVILPNGNKVCPKCGSGGRERRLWSLLKDNYIGQNLTHLDFSPARSLFRKLKKTKNHQYIASDLSGDFLSDVQFDITDIQASDGSYDLITCYHVLEHVPDDTTAMKELYRTLKSNGVCFIQTPFKDGEIYENPEVTTPEERLEHFGQEDHVRVYSVHGLKERLEMAGFEIQELTFSEKADNQFGFKTSETVLVCRKN